MVQMQELKMAAVCVWVCVCVTRPQRCTHHGLDSQLACWLKALVEQLRSHLFLSQSH